MELKVHEELRDKLDRIYKPGMSAQKLASESGCRRYQAHLYLGERLFQKEVLDLRNKKLSVRQIAKELDCDRSRAWRATREAK